MTGEQIALVAMGVCLAGIAVELVLHWYMNALEYSLGEWEQLGYWVGTWSVFVAGAALGIAGVWWA